MEAYSTAVTMVVGSAYLALGGWALGRFIYSENPPDQHAMGPVVLFCLLLGPFAAALALVLTARGK